MSEREICCQCGRSVAQGSGLFVNRVPVFDDFEDRKSIYKHPEGAWICRECDAELRR